MNNKKIKLQKVLSSSFNETENLKAYAIESFAKEIDYNTQNELLTKLILDHASIAKQIEELNIELFNSREMLAEAQGIAKLGRWDINMKSGSVIWSKSMYDILEINSSKPASSDLFFSFIHPEDVDNVKKMYQEMFSINKPWSTRYRLMMENGAVKWVLLRFRSKEDDNGLVSHFYGTMQDITEMKKVEDQLEKYNKHLEKLVEEKVEEITSSQMATIFALIKLSESRDDDTGAHIERTASFCKLLAEKVRLIPGYDEEIDDVFIETIYKAGPLHDIGKVGIPDKILLKPGKLTDEEFKIMKTHVNIGYDTLSKVAHQYDKNSFLKMGMDITLYHHEKWNGSGYNNGLSEDEIPLAARIMALSDVYDALRSKRVYKEAFSHDKSLEIIISSKGSHFDPILVDVFIQNHEEFKLLYESIK